MAEGVLAEQYEASATIVAAERLLFIDPIHEGAWQALIRAHMEKGDRAAARLVFDRCTATLANAGLAPSVATEELVGACCAGRCKEPATGLVRRPREFGWPFCLPARGG